MSLTAEEYGWLARRVSTADQRRGGDCNYVFHTFTGHRYEKPLNILIMSLKDPGMKGAVSFTKIHSSVSIQLSTSCVIFLFFKLYCISEKSQWCTESEYAKIKSLRCFFQKIWLSQFFGSWSWNLVSLFFSRRYGWVKIIWSEYGWVNEFWSWSLNVEILF